jgi:hypothetical protein
MKKILSVILICYLIFSCGGSQKPPLKDGIENPEPPGGETAKRICNIIKTCQVVLGIVGFISICVNIYCTELAKKYYDIAVKFQTKSQHSMELANKYYNIAVKFQTESRKLQYQLDAERKKGKRNRLSLSVFKNIEYYAEEEI